MSAQETKIYMFRHVQSARNLQPGIICGRSNETPITDLGRRQGYRLGQALYRLGILPDVAYVSPAIRAQDTARLCLNAMGLRLEPRLDSRLQEMSLGEAEGKHRDEVYTDDVVATIEQQGKNFKLPGGESMNEVGLEGVECLEELADRHTGQTVFTFSHGMRIGCTAGYIGNWPQPRIRTTEIPNASMSLFVHDGKKLCVPFIGLDIVNDQSTALEGVAAMPRVAD